MSRWASTINAPPRITCTETLYLVIMKSYKMKTDDLKSFELSHDADGRLYLKRFRELFAPLKVDMSGVEALSAVRFAGRSLHLLQERWAEQHGLSEGRMGVLFPLPRCGDMPPGEPAHALGSAPRNIPGLVAHPER